MIDIKHISYGTLEYVIYPSDNLNEHNNGFNNPITVGIWEDIFKLVNRYSNFYYMDKRTTILKHIKLLDNGYLGRKI